MKLNNKGITLVELIVSIALISIVIMFLFRLLIDVRYSNSSIDFSRENQQTRAIILKTIQEDLLEKKLNGFSISGDNASELSINLKFKEGLNSKTAQIIVTQDTLTYKNYDEDITEKWSLKDKEENLKFNIQCVKYSLSLEHEKGYEEEKKSDFFYIRFTIPIVMGSKNKNYIDDLEFFYLGEKKDIENIETAFSFEIEDSDFNNLNLKHYEDQCG